MPWVVPLTSGLSYSRDVLLKYRCLFVLLYGCPFVHDLLRGTSPHISIRFTSTLSFNGRLY